MLEVCKAWRGGECEEVSVGGTSGEAVLVCVKMTAVYTSVSSLETDMAC